jgi:acyl-CoA synthetase (AMP-forming)/AMP-acid ligase II
MQRLADCLSRWVKETPDHIAVSDEHASWTYGMLERQVEEAALYLKARDVCGGDRVVLVGENGTALVALILAAGRIDAWAVLENARCAAMEVAAVCEHAEARRVIYVVDNSVAAQEHAERHGAVAESTSFGRVACGPLNLECQPEPVFGEAEEQVAALIYTTGSTGTPKGVMLTHANLLHIGGLMKEMRRLTPADRVYGVLPVTHVMGLSSGLIGTLSAGAQITLVPRFSAQSCLDTIRQGKTTILQGAPAMFARLAKLVDEDGALKSSLRFIAVGGAPLDPALKTQVEAVFGLPLHNGYGLTEASGSCWTRMELDNPDCAVGPPNPGMEARIWGPDDKPVAEGEVGELWVRGPCVMKGYYRMPERSREVLMSDGWFNTQDLARRTPDGRIHIAGRTKDLIIRSGFNVSPLEVEMALNAHAAVQYSAVLGCAIEGNEEIIAVVERAPHKALSEEELRQFLLPRLSPYKRPTRIIFVQALPVAPNGKVLKHQLLQKLGDML